jgi:glutaredoxin
LELRAANRHAPLAAGTGLRQTPNMKAVRWFIGRIILFLNAVFSPKAIERPDDEQKKINSAMRKLSIYQYEACPFCVKVRRFMKAQSIDLPLKDAMKEPARSELLKGGGKAQVPCLRIENEDSSVKWMYESSDIVAYLQGKIAGA